MKQITCTVVLLFSLIFLQSASASSLRCGSTLITEGLRVGVTQYEVAKLCGEPAAKKGNRWVYDLPVNKISILVFDSVGQLIAIHKR